MRNHLVAVDIGTASARAGLFDRTGEMLAKAAFPIGISYPAAGQAEHDSDDIWNAVGLAVRAVLAETGRRADEIAAIGFDATCSLVVRGAANRKLSITESGASACDTILWLDHRACEEAELLSALDHPAIAKAGGRVSPEMAIPKLMWLKRHLPQVWSEARGIYDLADYMTFRASGSPVRSRSTLTAKWTFGATAGDGWDRTFLKAAGLEDIELHAGVSDEAADLGQNLGPLTAEAALHLGLDEQCVVAPGMIDAYAGTLGLLGGLASSDLKTNLALIAGTSTCVAWLSAEEPLPQAGFWGPYKSVALDGYWLMEGGQSAAGALLDHMVRMHAAGGEPDAALHGQIIDRIHALRAALGEEFGAGLDVVPDFHGNRSPLGDPRARGTISGLTLDSSFDGLCEIYWRTAVGLASGLRHIVETVEDGLGTQSVLHIAGGHARNPLLVSLYADMTGRTLSVPILAEPVLLGTAFNAAVAAGLFSGLREAAKAMTPSRMAHKPDPAGRKVRDRDYRRYLAMLRHRAELQAI